MYRMDICRIHFTDNSPNTNNYLRTSTNGRDNHINLTRVIEVHKYFTNFRFMYTINVMWNLITSHPPINFT